MTVKGDNYCPAPAPGAPAGSARFDFTWTFSRPVDRLRPGDAFSAAVTVTSSAQPPCVDGAQGQFAPLTFLTWGAGHSSLGARPASLGVDAAFVERLGHFFREGASDRYYPPGTFPAPPAHTLTLAQGPGADDARTTPVRRNHFAVVINTREAIIVEVVYVYRAAAAPPPQPALPAQPQPPPAPQDCPPLAAATETGEVLPVVVRAQGADTPRPPFIGPQQPPVAPPPVQGCESPQAHQARLRAAAREHLSQLLGGWTSLSERFPCWTSVARLGDMDKYLQALDEVELVVDPNLSGQGLYQPGDPPKLVLRYPPDDVPDRPYDLENYRKSLWHELTHRLEDKHGDFTAPAAPLPGYAERNTEWMEAVYGILHSLQPFEARLREGPRDPAVLRALWRQIEERYRAGSANQFSPTIIYTADELEAWTGFRVNLQELREHYESGFCGEVPAGVFDP